MEREWTDDEADVNDYDNRPTVGVPAEYANINRIEVIDEHGRAYVRGLGIRVQLAVQDGGRTLKVFVGLR